MNDPKPFASLSPSLLARKGAAKPAMRPQIMPMSSFHDSAARQIEDDLGWNDMGHDDNHALARPEPEQPAQPAEVVAISDTPVPHEAPVPPVVHQQAEVAALANELRKPAPRRRSALGEGRRAAFTLRLDAERHLKLRLACTLSGRSAQLLLIEALDNLISDLPDVATLAAQVSKKR